MRELDRYFTHLKRGSKNRHVYKPASTTLGRRPFRQDRICLSVTTSYFALLSVIYNLEQCEIASIESDDSEGVPQVLDNLGSSF